MRMSQLFATTLREVPAEAEIASHQLLLRAGMMRKAAGGIYVFLPLGLRVLHKIETIVREEMDRTGAQELLLPIVQPAELWQQTGRWDVYGEEMFRLQDRHGRSFCLGPTHEEIMTWLVANEVQSYRQLPVVLYQIQNKYRDEIRPRFGPLRSREFIMKDAYSFDRDAAGLDENYRKMYEAYSRIFTRCGLRFRPVEADSGAIGGKGSHEFMALADAGEAAIVYCDACGYAANVEQAECLPPEGDGEAKAQDAGQARVGEASGPGWRRVETPGQHTVEEVARFLHVRPRNLIKTMIYLADGQPVAVLVRGDHDVNEIKLGHVLDVRHVFLADAETTERVTGAPVGFAGPIGLAQPVPMWVDQAVMAMREAVTGGNAKDTHLVGVDPTVHFPAGYKVADLRLAQPGDLCPRCRRGRLQAARGIEVGQVFKLGTKYSEALGAMYLDENGRSHPIIMGCYGIGVSRTMAAIIEQCHDEHGIAWPMTVAPYQVIVVPVNAAEAPQWEAATQVYGQLQEAGVEVVLDDRSERPGVKFKDADLMGFPLRVTIGPRGLKEGKAELRWRASGQEEAVPLDQVVSRVQQAIADELQRYTP